MNKEEVLKSNALKKRFCRDTNMPITVFREPYFSQRLKILDPFYNGVSLFEDFCEMLKDFEYEFDYFEYYNNVKESMINEIKSSKYYEKFLHGDSFTNRKNSFPKRNLYIEDNHGKLFVSIDIKKANYTIMKLYCPDVMCESYEEFIGKFTSYKHLKNSKYTRQVVFGALNPKRQIKAEEELMIDLAESISLTIGAENIYSLSPDEIILTGNTLSAERLLAKVYEYFDLNIYDVNMFHITLFRLGKVTNLGYLKFVISPDYKTEFKCFDAETIHQVVNDYLGVPNTDDDLVFYHNNKLAVYLEEIDNPWSNNL